MWVDFIQTKYVYRPFSLVGLIIYLYLIKLQHKSCYIDLYIELLSAILMVCVGLHLILQVTITSALVTANAGAGASEILQLCKIIQKYVKESKLLSCSAIALRTMQRIIIY